MHLNQIIELSMVLDNENFQKVFDRAYSENTYEYDEEYIDCSFSGKGIIVIYRDSQYKKKVRLIVNTYLLTAEDLGTDKLIHKLDKRIGKVKKFSPVSFGSLGDNDSFCLSGNSNGIDFLLYDLAAAVTHQSKTSHSERKARAINGVIRSEVRLTKPKAIRAYTDSKDTNSQIRHLLKNSLDIFMDTFTQIIPFGDFYKKGEAVDIVRKEVADSVMRRKMLRLLALIPDKKSVCLAQKSMNCRDTEKIMAAFAKINLSPVTISKRSGEKYLRNFYAYIINCNI